MRPDLSTTSDLPIEATETNLLEAGNWGKAVEVAAVQRKTGRPTNIRPGQPWKIHHVRIFSDKQSIICIYLLTIIIGYAWVCLIPMTACF